MEVSLKLREDDTDINHMNMTQDFSFISQYFDLNLNPCIITFLYQQMYLLQPTQYQDINFLKYLCNRYLDTCFFTCIM